MELERITRAGNGCVWYLVNYFLDFSVGMFIAYMIFKIVDTIAIVFEIEVSKTTANAIKILKSGIYTREDVSLSEGDADKHIDLRIWVVQVFMWTSCIFIGKIFVFFQ
jgi:hypothetical protein